MRRSRNPLETQWEHVRLLERLPQPRGRGGIVARQLRDGLRARRDLAPLERWERISESSYRTYRRDANHVRLWRLLDFIRDGDRVLDIGVGFGYVTGILLRERRLEHYCGVDLKPHFLKAVDSMAAVNGLDTAPLHLEVKDLQEMTPEWMAAHRPNVVLVLEVLEHVADPQRALTALAAAIPSSAMVIFTVPLLGRLEGVWGHVSLFDRRRIEHVCRAAGLAVHYVEPLFATWVLVVASPSAAQPDRLRPILARVPRVPRLLQKAASRLPDPRYPSYAVTNVRIGGSIDYSRPHDDRAHVRVWALLTGVFCEVKAGADGSATGGARLAVVEPGLVRLQLSFTEPQQIEAVRVTGVTADGAERCAWVWDAEQRAIEEQPITHLLRPGRSTPRFRAAAGNVVGVVAVDVEIRVEAGGSAGFRLHRAAYVGPATEPLDAAAVAEERE